jgi:acyl-CoA reductase-like NAD-dependent aldehyde dehydrogenase
MGERLGITKTYKLYIGGKFPRTESGRTLVVTDASNTLTAHVCHASRKDLRDAVEAAGKAQDGWANATAYLRSQIIYRLAEMMEGKRGELAAAIGDGGEAETDAAIDRVVHFAGWCDKFSMVAGGANPVAGPYHNFTVPGPVGVTGVICPDTHPLLALVTLVAPVIAMGNACVVLASESNPIPAMVLAEALATSDLPAGVVNILTGRRDELVPHYASHRALTHRRPSHRPASGRGREPQTRDHPRSDRLHQRRRLRRPRLVRAIRGVQNHLAPQRGVTGAALSRR